MRSAPIGLRPIFECALAESTPYVREFWVQRAFSLTGQQKAVLLTPSRPIVFLSDSPGVWGAEHSMLAIAQEMCREGIRVALVTSNPKVRRSWLAMVGQEVTLVPLVTRRRLARGLLLVLAALRARPGALFLYSDHLAVWLPVLRVLPAPLRGHLVYDMHDYNWKWRPAWVMRATLPFTDLVVAVSRFALRPLDGHRFKKAVIHRPVADAATRSASPLQFEETSNWPCVGVIGRLDPGKRIELAIEAVSRVPEARLVIRGQADALQTGYAAAVAAHAAKKLGRRVEVQSERPQSEALAGIAVLVVSNPHEPLGRTVIEAQLSGVLAVVPSSGGSAELVGEGRYGVLYRAGDAADLARVLAEVVADPASFREIVTAARAWALRTCTPEAYVHSLMAAMRWAGIPSPSGTAVVRPGELTTT
jgi:glycosyltransferase involved in cell wall biosynthesis